MEESSVEGRRGYWCYWFSDEYVAILATRILWWTEVTTVNVLNVCSARSRRAWLAIPRDFYTVTDIFVRWTDMFVSSCCHLGNLEKPRNRGNWKNYIMTAYEGVTISCTRPPMARASQKTECRLIKGWVNILSVFSRVFYMLRWFWNRINRSWFGVF